MFMTASKRLRGHCVAGTWNHRRTSTSEEVHLTLFDVIVDHEFWKYLLAPYRQNSPL